MGSCLSLSPLACAAAGRRPRPTSRPQPSSCSLPASSPPAGWVSGTGSSTGSATRSTFKYEWSYIVSWIGVGLALISSILFSLAAVCIRTDKEREDAMNMQYLMPVYHQKQAQQPYGPYGYAAYPVPYYGS